MQDELLNYQHEQTGNPILIKVIGVGGGGGNAVENMFMSGIKDVSFVLCNTDKQVLNSSRIPNKLVLGESITRGLGAGNRPEIGRKAAENSEQEIRKMLDDGQTRMVFVTAGMGGGTGTGAAPVVSRIARDMGLLTVGIVTIPFIFEGKVKILQALEGVEEIRKNVDALLVVNNERLCTIYQDYSIANAFKKADETLTNAASGISNMINIKGQINVDFADVETTLKDGGVAIISSGYGEGDNRMQKAIDDALNSPLLNNNDIFKAQKVLINIYYSPESEVQMEEFTAIHELTAKIETRYQAIWGYAIDESLGQKVKVTILASGFDFSTTRASISQGIQEKPGFPTLTASNSQEIRQREKELIDQYYGAKRLEQITFKPVILSLAELDNDELIIELDRMPTLSRNLHNIMEIRKRYQAKIEQTQKAEDNEEAEDLQQNEETAPTQQDTILF
ncbi:Cell division protein FtsZ [Porphyromonas crevioricanis JCM 15906]|uniref:Cell division protein FtsZ n=1 Tax=Porphyromonas crevioricanis JCM 15906 TaxID=1305617 RepID=T1CM79_9PORP|nr:cell division protein FtsZ [Porphyromonas crevioricanis]GAD04787.1 Cell division protein FtsZ [Porphyromonas crevioricanis JCM 15906]SJZ98209.1 cell division protein FtsZ [Porphyromonas crevioricanis]